MGNVCCQKIKVTPKKITDDKKCEGVSSTNHSHKLVKGNSIPGLDASLFFQLPETETVPMHSFNGLIKNAVTLAASTTSMKNDDYLVRVEYSYD